MRWHFRADELPGGCLNRLHGWVQVVLPCFDRCIFYLPMNAVFHRRIRKATTVWPEHTSSIRWICFQSKSTAFTESMIPRWPRISLPQIWLI